MANPDYLKKEFAVMGIQLWFYAHGVDESSLKNSYRTKSEGIGNSQTLDRDDTDKQELEILLRGFTSQVAQRLRKKREEDQESWLDAHVFE
ncbi:TPA: hypothetical protein TY296_001595 [Streptococcus suis]|nr:hypothetical protein [Streptococcus suis]